MGALGFIKRLRERRTLLAPLAGYTNHPYRLILAEFDPPNVCTEMVSPHAVLKKTEHVAKMLEIEPGGHHHGVQLVGGEPQPMAEAARLLEGMGFDYVDINMGCVVWKVTRLGGGASLLHNEEDAYRVAKAVVDAVGVPVTCKIRLGASRESLNAVSLTRRLAEAGVAAVTVHGRTGERKFGEPVNHAAVREVVESASIPIVANGGIYTGEDAKAVLRLTGAAAVMPARGLIGNPWLVPEIAAAFSGKEYTPPSVDERRSVCLRHLANLVTYYGDEEHAVVSFRRTLPEYFRGCWHLKELRQSAHKTDKLSDVQRLVESVQQEGEHLTFRLLSRR